MKNKRKYWYKTTNMKRNKTFYGRDSALSYIRNKINRNIPKGKGFKTNEDLLKNKYFKFKEYFKRIKYR